MLGVSNEKLSSIERDNDHQANNCCRAMLAEWCNYDPTASHEEVQKTMGLLSRITKVKPFIKRISIEGAGSARPTLFSKPILPVKPGSSHQTSSSGKVCQFAKVALLLHNSNDITEDDAISVASVLYIGNVTTPYTSNVRPIITPHLLSSFQCSHDYYSKCNKYTDIMDIFVELEYSETYQPILLLLEGGPGMGKTTICKEAFCKLAESTKYELAFLVSLHDPKFQKIKSLEEFFESYCCKSPQKSLQDVKDYLDKTNGSNILIVVDGYDELDNDQQGCNSSFVADIVYRRYYPLESCDLMISSRQPQSAQLLQYHSPNCTRVEILGFTDDHKHQYIVQHCGESADILKEFFERRSLLHSVSHSPFFLANLVSLFKASKLPNSETEAIDRLVCSMILWCLQIQPPSHVVSITTWYEGLPSEYQLLIKEVSKYAFTAYQNDTFIVDTDGNVQQNGLGLLRALNLDINKTLFAFIHLGIQEFLVGFYITTLPSNEQETFRDQNLWSSKYMNVWFHYCGLVKDETNTIKMLFSGGWFGRLLGGGKMTDILRDKMKCLYLAYCFMQSPDDVIYQHVTPKFIIDDNTLDFSNSDLKAENITILYLYLAKSPFKQWRYLNFSNSGLNNEIFQKLTEYMDNSVQVDVINFTGNNIVLNPDSLFTLMLLHKTDHCIVTGNNITNDQITSTILSVTKEQWSKLGDRRLHSIQNYGSQILFHADSLKYCNYFQPNVPLVELTIIRCNFSDEMVDQICSVLKHHLALSVLSFYDNQFSCSNIIKIVDNIKFSDKTYSFLLYEKSMSSNDCDVVYQILSSIHSISQLLLVGTDNITSRQTSGYHTILALNYTNCITNLQLLDCHVTHEVMIEVAALLNSSPAPCNVLNLSGSRVDDSHLDILINALDADVTITSLSLTVSVSSFTVAELVCSVQPSSVNISGSLTDSNKQSVGMVVAENLFASQRQSTVMLTCADSEKIGILHKLDYLSSRIVENTSQLTTQLFINNCTIDGEMLAASLDDSKSVVLVHLSDIKWDGQVFYTSNSFISNERISMSVAENSLPDTVKQSILNTFDSHPNISRIISTDDVFIAHSCSYELVRWHLTQEASCDPLELFYLCNCPVTTYPGWSKVIAYFLNCRKVLSEVILLGNNISTRELYTLFLNTATESIKKLFISENVLNCSLIVSLLSAVPHITLLSRKMFISVKGVEKHISKAVNAISQQLEVLRMIHCKYTIESINTLSNAIKVCLNLQEFAVSGGNLMKLQASACTIILSALLGTASLTRFSFNDNKFTKEAVNVLKNVISINPKLEEIRLNNDGLKSAELKIICPSIAGLNKLKILSLTDNLISELAAADLANAIGRNSGLEKLYLDDNFLGTEGIASITSSIEKLTKLNVLRFKNNKFQAHKLPDIKLYNVITNNQSLENVCFDNNQLSTTIMRKVAQALVGKSQLKIFGVSNCGITKEAASSVADIITSSTKLMKLQISDNALLTEGLDVISAALKTVTTLTKLYISNNNITEQAADGIAEAINNNPSLQVLDIGNNLLLTSGIIKIAKALSKICKLEELWMNNNYVTEEAAGEIAAAITSNTKLMKLQLDNNSLETTGVCKICKALKEISGLKVLLIGNNFITHQSADDIAAVITNNPFIEVLYLGNNRLGTSGAIKIAKALSQVHHVKAFGLDINSEAAGDIASAIASNVGLEKLWLQNSDIDSEGIHKICYALERVNNLKIFLVNQKGTKTLDSILTVASKHWSSLETLCISECTISTSNMVKFTDTTKSLYSLKQLKVNDNYFADEAAGNLANIIASSTELEQLGLFSNKLRDSGLIKIMSTTLNQINSLRALHLENSEITESSAGDVAKVIANNPFLESVSLGYNRLKAVGVSKLVSAFKKLFCLKELSLSSNHLDVTAANDVASMIIGKSRLEKLWINNNRFKEAGLNKICESLKKLSSLKALQLENTDMTPDAADDIADVLNNNWLLEDLYLGYNKLQTEGVIKLSAALKQLHCLKRLNFNDNQITELAACGIADVITSNSGLEKLWLYKNHLKDEGINVITSALKGIHHLKLLQLENNGITQKAADNVAQAISSNHLLETIRVGNNPLTNQGVTKLASALKGLHQIKTLGLNGIKIGKEVVKHIAEVIYSNTGLEKLYLNNNRLEGIGVKELCEGITQHSSFKCLQLSNNSINEEAADVLADVITSNKLLEECYLGDNRLQSTGIRRLAIGLKSLHSLKRWNISDNQISEEAAEYIASVLASNGIMENLWLDNNPLNDRGIETILFALNKTKSLKLLHIGNTNITEEVADSLAKAIANNPFLESVYMKSNKLGSRGVCKLVKSLSSLCFLKNLELNGNMIEEDAAKHIAEVINNNTGLEELWLKNNRLKGVGMKQFCECIRHHSNFRLLQLESNQITAEAADDLAVMISNNQSLEELYLGNNILQTNGINVIVKALTQLNGLIALSINDNYITEEAADNIAEVIANNPLLEHIELGGNRLGSRGVVKLAGGLKMLRHLKILGLSDNKIEEDVVKHIAEVINNNTGLEKLHLSKNRLKRGGAKQLCELIRHHSNFKIFDLENNDITDETVDELAAVIDNNKLLEEFSLQYNKLTAIGINRIVKSLKTLVMLKQFNISDNEITRETAFDLAEIIANNTGLRVVLLSNSTFNDLEGINAIFCALMEIHTLYVLKLDHCSIPEKALNGISAAIANNPLLEYVDLGGNRLGSRGVVKLAGGLKTLHHLKMLGLYDNEIEEDAAKHIAEVINNNTGLEALNLTGNKLKGRGMKQLCINIKKHSCFKALYIQRNLIDEEAVDDLSTLITNNKYLEVLCLGYNRIKAMGVTKITKSLQTLRHALVLTISGNSITEQAANGIANFITNNTAIMSLLINNSLIKDKGIKSITCALVYTKSLKALHLSNNNITEEAADDIAEATANNPSLECLDLGGNRLGSRGVVKLAGGLKMLRQLKILRLSDNGIKEDAAKHIAEVINKNTGLEELYLHNNSLKGAGIKDLCKGIKQHSSFKILRLDDNDVTEEAANDLSFVINQNKHLINFNIGKNNLKSKGIHKLIAEMKQLQNLKSISFYGNQITSEVADGIAEVIVKNRALRRLQLSNNFLGDKGIKKLSWSLVDIVSLAFLSLANNCITEEAADCLSEAIANNPLLELVELGGNRLGSKGVIKLAGGLKMLHHLKILGLNNNAIKEDAAKHIAEVINNNTGLEKLYLNDNKLKGTGLKELCGNIKKHSNFKVLKLQRNSITEEAADDLAFVISNNKFLEVVDFSKNELGCAAVNTLINAMKQLYKLTKLPLSGNQVAEEAVDLVAEIITNNNELNEISLSGSVLNNKKFFWSCSKVSTLKALHLADNNITEEAANDIAEAIVNNPLLEYVDLGGNKLGSRGVVKLAGGLKMLHHLKILGLYDNEIEEDAAKHIAEVINNNTGLMLLKLTNNKFKGPGMQHLFAGMKQPTRLTAVQLNNNLITEEAADDIATVVSSSEFLRVLCLGGNKLKSAGVITIMSALTKLHVVKSIDISDNEVTDEAADSIAAVLLANPSMKTFTMHDNYLTSKAARVIVDAVAHHASLSMVSFASTQVSKLETNKIQQIIEDTTEFRLFNNRFTRISCAFPIKSWLEASIAPLVKHIASKVVGNDTESSSKNIEANLACRVDMNVLKTMSALLLVKVKEIPSQAIRAFNHYALISWSAAAQLETLFQGDELCKTLSTLVVKCAVDAAIDEFDVAVLKNLIDKLENLEYLDIGRFSPFSSSRTVATQSINIPNNLNCMSLKYQKSFSCLNLTGSQLQNILGIQCTIKLLNLSGNIITLKTAEMLSEAISRFINLETLLMEDCGLQSESLLVIIGSLSSAKLLTVDLSNNDISSAATIVDMACTNVSRSLANLYLDRNSFKSLQEANFSTVLVTLTDLSIDIEVFLPLIDLFKIFTTSKVTMNLKRLFFCDHSCKEMIIIIFTNALKYVKKISLIQTKKISRLGNDDLAMMPCHLHSLTLMAYIKVNVEAVTLLWSKGVLLKNMVNILRYCEEFVCYNDSHDEHLTEEDAEPIAAIIACNANLTVISLSRYFSSPIKLQRHQKIDTCNASPIAIKKILFAIKHTKLNLKILNLSGNSIEDTAAEILTVAVAECTMLEVLLLASCDLQSKHIARIGRQLTIIGGLKILDLSHNNLSEELFSTITAIIASNQNLLELYIHSNSFHLSECANEFLMGLSKCKRLAELSIDGELLSVSTLCQMASFTDCGIRRLFFSHPNLVEIGLITLSKCLETAEIVIFKYFLYFVIADKSKTLEWRCSNEPVPSEIIKFLSVFKNTASLILYGFEHFTEQDVDEVANVAANLTLLEKIAIQCITPNALLRLLHSMNVLKSLKEITIIESIVDDNMACLLAEVLGNNKEINHLRMQNCHLQVSQITAIMPSLQNRAMKMLDLSSNYMSDKVADYVANVILSSCASLEHFNIEINQLHANGMIHLLNFLKDVSSLKSISLSCNEITDNISENITEVIYNNHKLTDLCLHDVYLQTQGAIKIAKALLCLPSLNTLDLSNNCIGEEAAKDLAILISHSHSLKDIRISENKLGSNGVIAIADALSTLVGLEVLDIMNTDANVKAAGSISDVIVSNSQLKLLLIGSGQRQVNSKQLESMWVDEFLLQQKWCTKIKGEHHYLESLLNTTNCNKCIIKLLDIDIENTKPPIPNCNKLQTNGILKICQALKQHKSLQRFSIENNSLDDEAADDIAAAIASNTETEQLWIGSNCFSPSGILVILKSAEAVSKLEVLDLSHCDFSLEASYSVARVLNVHGRIKQFWLENSTIPKSGLIAILMSLLNCSHVALLSLRYTIGNPNVMTLSTLVAFMCECRIIQCLYLGNNDLCDKNTKVITPYLAKKHGLHTLDLSSTNITAASVDSIVKVITSNSQLQQLFLGGNKLCSSGAIKIVTALQGSHTIQVLGLSHNHITSEAAGEISTAVSTMPYLSTLMLDGNELEVDGVCTIIEGVQQLNWLMILSLTDNVNNDEEEVEDVRRKFTDNKFKLYL